MNEFDAQLLRLKEALGVVQDQDVATALGLSKQALSSRRNRGVSLKDKVLALAADRPDLHIDVDKVLHGEEGGYSVVRSGQLVQVMTHFQWSPVEFAAKLGMDRERAATFGASLGSSAGIKLRKAAMDMLVKEFRVRREFLVHGVEPMFGDDEDEVAELSRRMQRLEAQLSSVTAALHDMAKSNAAFQAALTERFERTSGPKYRPKPAGPNQPSIHEAPGTYAGKRKNPSEAA